MKAVTLREVAREAGLTKSAVSLALRHDPRIPPATRRRVAACARRLGYRRNAVVAHLMSELRRGTEAGPRATVALLNLNESPHALTRHPTIPSYVRGIRQRATTLGYAVDVIPEPAALMEGKRLQGILQARGIRGCVLVGLLRSNRLPAHFAPLWEHLPCVIAGARTVDPQLPSACADHHAITQMAAAMALRAGRRRPALVLDREIDQLVQGRFTGGFLIAQRDLPAGSRIPPFYHGDDQPRAPAGFGAWLERHRPDAILTLYHVVEDWLRDLRVRVPRDIALIQLESRPHKPPWAGVNQHNDLTGAAAMDLLVQMIHAGETAAHTSPRAMLIEPSWTDGPTLPAGTTADGERNTAKSK